MTKHLLTIFGSLAVVGSGCGGRTVDSDTTWEDRVQAACEKNCEVAACNPHNLYFEDEATCLEACTGSEQVAQQSACAEAALEFTECLGSLSCEQAEARSAAVMAGEVPAHCQDEAEKLSTNCEGGD